MKKTTANKSNKTQSNKSNFKKRSYISDMMRRDRELCKKRDKELEKAGVKKPTKDIYKDDPCYGCKFALENTNDDLGPFDRRFFCNGFSRMNIQLQQTMNQIKQASIAKNKELGDRILLMAQNTLLYVASLIGERVANGMLECVDPIRGKPSCYNSPVLEDFLKK